MLIEFILIISLELKINKYLLEDMGNYIIWNIYTYKPFLTDSGINNAYYNVATTVTDGGNKTIYINPPTTTVIY